MKLTVTISAVIIGCMLTVVLPTSLFALEYSAAANALNGVTALSQSVADYNLSPLIGSSGITVSYFSPFSIPEIQTFGLYTAFRGKHSTLDTGMTYLMHDDYKWQDSYVGGALRWEYLSIGATQHITMDYIRDSETTYMFGTDFGLRLQNKQTFGDVVWQRVFTNDAKWGASLGVKPMIGSAIAIAYSDSKGEHIFSVAGKHRITPALSVLSSWQNEPARLGVGIELQLSQIQILYGIRTHPELKMSHAIDLNYHW